MERRNHLTEVWDFYRTAPYAETFLTLGWLSVIRSLTEGGFDFSDHELMLARAIWAGCILLYTKLCVSEATRQFTLRHRLEESIKSYGYTDEAFKTTTREWCTRQTATVVVDHSGNRGAYRQLCARSRKGMELPFVPNF